MAPHQRAAVTMAASEAAPTFAATARSIPIAPSVSWIPAGAVGEADYLGLCLLSHDRAPAGLALVGGGKVNDEEGTSEG